jgi:hypothetical protein
LSSTSSPKFEVAAGRQQGRGGLDVAHRADVSGPLPTVPDPEEPDVIGFNDNVTPARRAAGFGGKCWLS